MCLAMVVYSVWRMAALAESTIFQVGGFNHVDGGLVHQSRVANEYELRKMMMPAR